MLPFNYILFDAAKAEQHLYRAMELNPDHKSLYKGWAEDDLSGVAPYLFSVKPDSPFIKWFMAEGMGHAWGVPLFANAAFDDVYNHFRKFLMIKTEYGEQLYFRFYDPRVLRIFLPTCDRQQIKEFFGPVRHFIAEGEEPGVLIQFWQENYELRRKETAISDPSETRAADHNKSQADPSQVALPEEAPLTETGLVRMKKKWKFDLE